MPIFNHITRLSEIGQVGHKISIFYDPDMTLYLD